MIDDLKTRFGDLDPNLIDEKFPTFSKVYKHYYNADYGQDDLTDEVILNLLAHLITLSQSQSDGARVDVITSMSIGSGSITNTFNTGDNSNWDNFFGSTFYGQTFLILTATTTGIKFI